MTVLFVVLDEGHIAYKCIKNKSCFYCGRRNHHDRSFCPLKFATNEKTLSAEKEIQRIKGECQITETKKEYSDEPAKKEINRFAVELAKEIADLQLRHTELSNKLLSIKEKTFNIQKQNNHLGIEQSKVFALMKFKT